MMMASTVVATTAVTATMEAMIVMMMITIGLHVFVLCASAVLCEIADQAGS